MALGAARDACPTPFLFFLCITLILHKLALSKLSQRQEMGGAIIFLLLVGSLVCPLYLPAANRDTNIHVSS